VANRPPSSGTQRTQNRRITGNTSSTTIPDAEPEETKPSITLQAFGGFFLISW
jgi:hypothetical protein